MREYLKVWTFALGALAIGVYVTAPTYMGCGTQPSVLGLDGCDIATLTPPALIGLVWLIGVIVLLVAERRGAFKRARSKPRLLARRLGIGYWEHAL